METSKQNNERLNKDGLRQQDYKKGKYQPMTADDLTAIIEIGTTAIEKRYGAHPKYTADASGLQEFICQSKNYLNYVQTVNSNPEVERKLIIDIESWCVFLGITRETLRQYAGRSKEWQDFIAFFKEIIASGKKQLSLTGKIPPMIAVFDLTNNHNYRNTNEFHLQTTQNEPEQELSAEELLKKARKLVGFSEEEQSEE